MPKVEIQVAGHCVSVESTDPLEKVTSTALDLFRKTRMTAKKGIAVGFSSNNVITQVAETSL